MTQPNKVIAETARQCNPAEGNSVEEQQTPMNVGGLRVRTDLRAGLAWDDLDDQAQQLWGNLTNMLSNLTGGADSNS